MASLLSQAGVLKVSTKFHLDVPLKLRTPVIWLGGSRAGWWWSHRGPGLRTIMGVGGETPTLPYSYRTVAAAAAKSLQSCPTLWDPRDGSPPGSLIPGILQARTLEWVAISFSSAWKWKVKVKSLSRVWPSATPWTAAFQAIPSMGFSRQEYWSGVPLQLLQEQILVKPLHLWDGRFCKYKQIRCFKYHSMTMGTTHKNTVCNTVCNCTLRCDLSVDFTAML